MGLIGFTDTKTQARALKNKQKFHKDIKISPVHAAFGKVAYWEVKGKPKKIYKTTSIKGNKKIITSYVKNNGRRTRLSSDHFTIRK